MLILAHRGYSAKYPENTFEAFVKAYEKGFDGFETDVHMTKDGELVLIHDETIDRTSNGQGYIKDMTLSELRKYNFCYKCNGFYPIPTLKELLEFIQDKDLLVNIEIKTDKIQYTDIERKVIELVEELGVKDKVIYSSFYLKSLLKVREINPQAYIGYLCENNYKKKIESLFQHHIYAFHPRHTYLREKNIEMLKKNKIFIATWTVPNLKKYQRLKELGVDIIISNEYFK